MSEFDRRGFLLRAAKLTAGGTILAPSLTGLIACNDAFAPNPRGVPALRHAGVRSGYGELVAHPSLPFLIPEDFQLKLVSRAGDQMKSGGGTVPNALDGMCALPVRGAGGDRADWKDDNAHDNGYRAGGRVRLVRNHEIRDGAASTVPMGSKPYDAKAGGGCTTLEVQIDKSGEPHLVEEFVSISGTCVNCAGGPTPWGSWLTCEETTEGIPQGRLEPHGYVFEVPAGANSECDALPLKEMGRFSHEAIAVDPRFGHVYETEDAGNSSGFYRFIPNVRRELAAGGRLQMLAVRGRPGLDTTRSAGITPLTALPAEWVDIDNPDPAVINSTTSVFSQGFARGGTRFARLEGCWWGDESVFFVATSGGARGSGQVWQYRPLTPDTGELVLIFDSPGPDVLDAPDNICVSPRGGLVLCEDGGGAQFMRGLTQDGFIFDFVRSADPNDATEFAGACFSPDGGTLFFNTQGSTTRLGTERGGTFAIWGPWETGAL